MKTAGRLQRPLETRKKNKIKPQHPLQVTLPLQAMGLKKRLAFGKVPAADRDGSAIVSKRIASKVPGQKYYYLRSPQTLRAVRIRLAVAADIGGT